MKNRKLRNRIHFTQQKNVGMMMEPFGKNVIDHGHIGVMETNIIVNI